MTVVKKFAQWIAPVLLVAAVSAPLVSAEHHTSSQAGSIAATVVQGPIPDVGWQ